MSPADDPLAEKRARFLALAADVPARCRLVEVSEGNPFLRKLRKLYLFRGRYLRWIAAQAGLSQGEVVLPLFWGGRMRLPYADESDFVTFYLAGAPAGPEYKLVRYFIRTLKQDDCFYDAGANYGFYTLLAAEFVGFGGEVHAFEPMPSVHARLVGNSPGPIARIVNAALWDRGGMATLYRHPLGDACSTLESAVAGLQPARDDLKIEVRCTTLDDYIKENRPPTVIKIDVEGGEGRLITGGLGTLRTARPVVAMEVWARENGVRFSLPACRLLMGLGYTAHRLSEDGRTSPLAADDLPDFLRSMTEAWDNLVFLPA